MQPLLHHRRIIPRNASDDFAMLITRRLDFDAGHRIPDHASQCKHLHGHRYAIEITLRGRVIDLAGDTANCWAETVQPE
jgi:hypothetical protein